MLTRDAFKNITFQKSRVRAEIGATFEEFVVKLNSTIDKLQESYAALLMYFMNRRFGMYFRPQIWYQNTRFMS